MKVEWVWQSILLKGREKYSLTETTVVPQYGIDLRKKVGDQERLQASGLPEAAFCLSDRSLASNLGGRPSTTNNVYSWKPSQTSTSPKKPREACRVDELEIPYAKRTDCFRRMGLSFFSSSRQ